MNSALISIIITVSGKKNGLDQTLNGLLNQTYLDWECIIVFQDTELKIPEEISNLFECDLRFKIHKPQAVLKGENSCRNIGCNISNGKYIIWFKCGDVMEPNHLEILIKAISAQNLDFIIGDSIDVNFSTGEIEGKSYVFDRTNRKITVGAFVRQEIGWNLNDFLVDKDSLGILRFNESLNTGSEFNFFVRYLEKEKNGDWLNAAITKNRLLKEVSPISVKEEKLKFLQDWSLVNFKTFLNIRSSENTGLKKLILDRYMFYSFNLARERRKPRYLLKSVYYIGKLKSGLKALSFLLAVTSGFFFNKGYAFFKYSRK